ncbi:MAG TPA: lipid-A-disaccharide synthase [Bacteroidales bacterium]|nr:lipid-A-disaccharide synthase [Bacteroidales bacterium]
MRYFILSGEPSGDLHGSNLVRSLLREDPDAEIACWGGELMEQAGARLLKHYRDLAFMGVWEVIINLRTVLSNFKTCREQISGFNPDVVILIDYPGFNLRIAKYVKKLGIKVYYYISPKFWAWNESRVNRVKRSVDRMYIIFPFEVDFYHRHGYDAHYIGNPLVDEVENRKSFMPQQNDILASLGLGGKPVIALLSGSRKQEVVSILPQMVKVIKDFPEYDFVITAVSHIPEKIYKDITGDIPVKIVTGKTYEILSVAEAALVTSGTATLETALFNVPQVVCYCTSALTYQLSKMVIKVNYISLVNLIMNREIIVELIQKDLNTERLRNELSYIISGGSKREKMLDDYSSLHSILGGPGASSRIAGDIVKTLNSVKK